MNIEVEQAVKFIGENGTDFQKSWYKHIINGWGSNTTLSYIRKYQNTDGGFWGMTPDYKGIHSSIVCTMAALKKLEYLNIKKHDITEKIKSFLIGVQRGEGYWDESNLMLQFSVPKRYMPRYRPNQIWYTNGLLRYFNSFFPEEKQVIEKAKSFLKKNWIESGFVGNYLNDYFGIVCFSNFKDKLECSIFKTCVNNLHRNLEEYDCFDVVWAMQSLFFLNIPDTEETVGKGITLIKNSQLSDGGIKSQYGMYQRVDATIESLALLSYYNKIEPENNEKAGD